MKFSILFPVHNPGKKAHPQDEIQAFLDAERHEFQERHDSSALWAREMPKIRPRKTQILGSHNSSLPWARESPNPTMKNTNFGKLHSLTPAKMPTK